jgi:hypothetical protein
MPLRSAFTVVRSSFDFGFPHPAMADIVSVPSTRPSPLMESNERAPVSMLLRRDPDGPL